MLCWGSWANTQKLAGAGWRFQLFYWDYAIGVFLLSLILAFTLGQLGRRRPAVRAPTWRRPSPIGCISAFLGGVIFNLSNILLVAAIDIAGMAVAFPVGVGLALVLGVLTTYLSTREGNAPMLAAGVAFVGAAIVLDALAYGGSPGAAAAPRPRASSLSVAAGVLMGLFYKFVAQSMGRHGTARTGVLALEAGKLSPYTAVVVFSAGVARLQLRLELRHHGQAVHRRPGAVPGLFHQGQRAAARRRHPGRR